MQLEDALEEQRAQLKLCPEKERIEAGLRQRIEMIRPFKGESKRFSRTVPMPNFTGPRVSKSAVNHVK